MTKFSFITSILIGTTLSLVFFSCGKENKDMSVIHEGARDNIEDIAMENIVSIDDRLPIMHTCAMMLIGDTILFNDHMNDELKFTAYDIYKDKVIGRFGKPGSGPGELANYGGNFYDNKNILYLSEANQGKILGYNLPDAINNPEYTPFVKANMSFVGIGNAYITPNYLNDSTIICSALSRSKNSGSLTSRIGRLNLINQSVSLIDTLSKDDNIRYTISVSPEQDRIYATGRTHDEIRIYDIDGNLMKIIYGPDYDERIVKRSIYFSQPIFCGDKILSIYAGGKETRGQEIIVMDRDGRYIKTLRFSIPLFDIEYHAKSDRLYLSTDAAPQFGYIENFGALINDGNQAAKSVSNNPIEEFSKEDIKDENINIDVADKQDNPTESIESQPEKTTTATDDGKVKIIYSDSAAAAAAKVTDGKSSAGPLILIDANTHGERVEHLNVGAYPEGDEYVYTIGFFNRSDETVEIESICLPDGYFKASWSSANTLNPNMVKFLRLVCSKPLDKKEYPVIVHFRDKKLPAQTLSITLYRSGAQLYNEMHNN